MIPHARGRRKRRSRGWGEEDSKLVNSRTRIRLNGAIHPQHLDASFARLGATDPSPPFDIWSLEPRRTLTDYAKRPLQSQASSSDRAFIEQSADQGDAMRHAARRRKARHRMVRIRRPIATCF